MNYFKHKGEKYYEGTIVEFEDRGKVKYGEYTGSGDLFTSMISPTEYEANGKVGFFADNVNIKRIVKAVNSYSKIEKVKAYRDTDCDDMFYAWVAYIAAMIFVTLFNGRVFAWACITVIFYCYRNNKLYMAKRSYDSKKRNGGI